MPLEFLREIETGTLPRQVTKTGDIDLPRLLCATGMVEADLPDVEGSGTAPDHWSWSCMARREQEQCSNFGVFVGPPGLSPMRINVPAWFLGAAKT